jgi:hypothetical protein
VQPSSRAASRSGFLPLSDQLEYFLLLWLANEATICIIMRPAGVAVSMAKKFNSAAPIYNTQAAISVHLV